MFVSSLRYSIIAEIPYPLAADHAHYRICDLSQPDVVDEIDDFWNARYLSAGEGAWKMLGYWITMKKPAVTALPIHLPPLVMSSNSFETKSLLEHYFA